MSGNQPVRLGAVQETLFIPLFDRVRHASGRRPLLRDPRAVEIAESVEYVGKYTKNTGGVLTVLRTMVFDTWAREFLRRHPAATVVELGTGLNTRFERVDNGTVHWIDLDLPDTIALRGKFFADTGRRRALAASVLDADWLDVVADSPGPYLVVSEGVLPYLEADAVEAALSRIAARFPDSLLALDSYHHRTVALQHRAVAKGKVDASFGWGCDDPRHLRRLGLHVLASTGPTRPPRAMRAGVPPRYRLLLPVCDPVARWLMTLTLFRLGPG